MVRPLPPACPGISEAMPRGNLAEFHDRDQGNTFAPGQIVHDTTVNIGLAVSALRLGLLDLVLCLGSPVVLCG